MRLPVEKFERIFALSLVSLLAACGGGGADYGQDLASADNMGRGGYPGMTSGMAGRGINSDFPVVLGDPYEIEGKTYTPADKLNHDEVGYATEDYEGGQSISGSHKTLPLPSYVEVTSLDSGKSALVRLERRGPMTNSRTIALSPGAMAQLGIVAEGSPVRVRRVNPSENERASLRMGQAAAPLMDMPKPLRDVLRKKLPEKGSLNLARVENLPAGFPPSSGPGGSRRGSAANDTGQDRYTGVAGASGSSSRRPPARVASTSGRSAQSGRGYALPSLNGGAATASTSARLPAPSRYSPFRDITASRSPVASVRSDARSSARSQPRRSSASASSSRSSAGDFVVQAASFSSKANAQRMANKIGGFVEQSGRYYRVRQGPYASRGQAEAALAKLKAAGYRGAKVYSAG